MSFDWLAWNRNDRNPMLPAFLDVTMSLSWENDLWVSR